jgi:uncharacterized protein
LVARQAETGDSPEARALIETNLWSPIALAAALLPGMRAGRRPAAIVNVTSTVQAVPIPLLGYVKS